MKTLNRFIVEKLKLGKNIQINNYNFYPESFNELKSLLKQLLEERGKDANLNDIDVSQITTFFNKDKGEGLFEGLDPHNIDISEWNVSNVKNMENMFFDCYKFNSNLSNWNVSNVENMSWTFTSCEKFNCDLSNWNVSNVVDTMGMFYECENFNCDLSNWDVSKVENMHAMFYGCIIFIGQGLENWNVSNVVSMTNMFDNCKYLKNKPSWYKE